MKYYSQLVLFIFFLLWMAGCSESTPSGAKTPAQADVNGDEVTARTSPTVRTSQTSQLNRGIGDAVNIKATAFDPALYEAASLALGGLAYDEWWVTDDLGTLPPVPAEIATINHPLWPAFNTRKSNTTTWRCKSCHGWDYRGQKGPYGSVSSSYYTRIKGLIPADGDVPLFTQAEEIFAFIDEGQYVAPGDHAFGAMLTPEVLHALTKFVVSMQEQAAQGVEPGLAIDSGSKLVTGINGNASAANGKAFYDLPTTQDTAGGGCGVSCHDIEGSAAGRAIDFNEPFGKFLDTYAWDNPWEVLHKIRFGQPDADPQMPGIIWYGNPALDFQAAVDILRHMQETLIPSEQGFDVTRYAASKDQIAKDFARGGLLWDKWWVGTDESAVLTVPSTAAATHGLWASTGNTDQTNDTTWRCKSCHGWDYLGAAGAYGAGSYVTGIRGVVMSPDGILPANMAAQEVFDMIHSGVVNNAGDHAFSASGISTDDVHALTRFVVSIQEEALDGKSMAAFIDSEPTCYGNVADPLCYNVVSGGDASAGKVDYDLSPYDPAAVDALAQGGCGTTACHGTNGREIVVDETLYMHDLARINPWEYLHKVRFGHPGSEMLGTVDYQFSGLDLQSAADVTKYSQGGLARDIASGGRLYDNWMVEAALDAPAGRHLIFDWQDAPDATLADDQTWRCAMCHGWDYRGSAGLWNDLLWLRSVRGEEATVDDLYKTIQGGYPVLDAGQVVRVHNFGDFMGETELWSLAEFIKTGVADVSGYVRAFGAAYNGDAVNGGLIYNGGATAVVNDVNLPFSCVRCHGAAGAGIAGVDVFASAWDEPWRFFHKVRFGTPMSPDTLPESRMFGVLELTFTAAGHTGGNHDATDILNFVQDKSIAQ